MGFKCDDDCPAACCKHIHNVKELAEFCLPDGSCKKLSKNDRCTIYNTRPDVCRVDKRREVYFPHIVEEVWIKLNKFYCKVLRKKLEAKKKS